jgi:3-oxoacyl-[acyl-carrier protein] reductase
VVVGYGRDTEGARQSAAAVEQLGRRAWLLGMDVADAAEVAAAVGGLAGRLPGLDCLVLCAGRNQVTPFAELTPAEWAEIVAVNLNGTFHVLQAARPLLRPGASVVIVASVAAHTGAPHHAHYAAAKAGLVNLAKSAARALAPAVRVNCVAPGIALTPMGNDAVASLPGDYAGTRLLAGRFADPEEVARTLVFVASPAASFLRGATLDVNGGRELR